jgi:hypothetical protein
MTLTRPAYCTRETVRAVTDQMPSARMNALIDSAIASAADTVDAFLNRVFYPTFGTRYRDWPDSMGASSFRLWLEDDELISLTSVTAGGTALTVGNLFLEPINTGPPYDRIEVNTGTTTVFRAGTTHQRAIALTGVFGYRADTAPAGALAEALDTTETAVDVTNSALIGVGDLLISDTEYMLVTDSTWLTTGQTVQTPLTADVTNNAVAVTTGSAYAVGETLLLDTERMRITDVAGNTLTVERAVDGSVLATHAGSTIYAPRTLTVARHAVGTTAATHSSAAALSVHAVPALVAELALGETLVTLAQRSGAYARPSGQGAGTRPQPGAGLEDLRTLAFKAYGRINGPMVV